MSSYLPSETTAFILAAGHGKRMLPLTQSTPKPLLTVNGLSLIEYHLKALYSAGFRHIVINIAYLGDQIRKKLGDGESYGLQIHYSDETSSGALETAGGIRNALDLIESDVFVTVNADIWTDYDFSNLLQKLDHLGRLILVNNPAHNPGGDFTIGNNNLLSRRGLDSQKSYTFSGIALYKKTLFSELSPQVRALAPVLFSLIEDQNLEGIVYDGEWKDIGTPQRLQELATQLEHSAKL